MYAHPRRRQWHHASTEDVHRFCWRVGGTPLCAGAPRCVVPPCGPPAVLCAPLWWARASCAAPPCGGFLPRVLVPPRGVVAPTETIGMTA